MPKHYSPALPPRAHQIEGLEKARGRAGFGWLMEMGTGKTKTDLDETGRLWADDGDIDAFLMLAPKGVYTNWLTDEVPKHWRPDMLEDVLTHKWQGGGTRREQDALKTMMDRDYRLRFLCMNIEGIGASDRAFAVAEEFVRRHAGRVKISIDESTAIKNPQAVRTRSIGRLRDMASVRRILSGQPVPNGPMDLYSQMDWAVPGSLGRSFFAYRARYAVMQKQFFGSRAVQQIVGYRDLTDLAERIRPHTFRKRKEECLDLPEQIYTPFRNVELTAQQERIYREVRDNATAAISSADDSTYVTATLVLTQLLRMQQVLCGHVVDEEGRTHQLDTRRPQAALDWTEECRNGGVIWCTFQDDIQRLTEALERAYPGRVAPYHGGISQDECDVSKLRFQNGDADWFLGSLQKGSRGLTLVRASDTLYYSNSQNLDHRDQSESRTHRDGQHWPCTYSDLVVPGTIEETIVIPSLRKKIDLATAVLSDPTRSWLI